MTNFLRILACLFFATPAFAQEDDIPSAPVAQTQLLLHAPQIVKDQPIEAGILFTLPEGWHIYWLNPGDSGIAPTLAWTLPEGISASDIHWPVPQHIESSDLYNYGYAEKVILPVTLTPANDDIAGPVSVKADWLVCKEICIPESATLTGMLPAESPQAELLLQNEARRQPREFAGTAHYSATADTVTLTIAATQPWGDTHAGNFYPEEDGVATNAATKNVMFDEGRDHSITLQFARGGAELPPVWHGVLATSSGHNYRIAAEQRVEAPIAPATPIYLPWLLLLAMLGGLLLNLMPCVLPILSLKALALAKKSGAEQRHARAQGIAYTLGVIASFMGIAALMLALKSAGAVIGWGFQLQEPAVITALYFLMLMVAFNLLGLFEMPVLFGNAGGNTHSLSGTFLTGALAVALATPCSAPFMATAIGATLSLPTVPSLLVFAALGFGMAAPFLLISLVPAARRFLPKPGAWMERFKHFLAFPMFATAAWLLWVLVQINGAPGLAVALAGGVGLAWLLWLAHGKRSVAHAAFVLAALALSAWAIAAQPMAMAKEDPMPSQHFSEDVLRELRAEGRPVFVDATAAWCITCKINERVALNDNSVKALFAEQNVALLVADWTTRDEAITRYLASFGRNGVPLYVYYPPHGEPQVLPQLLTPASVRAAIAN